MAYHDPRTDPPHYHETPPPEPSAGWTSYAAVKYGFILLIVLAILAFIAFVIVPLFT